MADNNDSRTEQIANICHRLEPLLRRTDFDPRPVALMLCGVAGSGKSTISKAIVQKFPSFIRLSIDGIIAERHGLYGVDYPTGAYRRYQEEADELFLQSLKQILSDRTVADVILDRSSYAKEDRDAFRTLVERYGGRVVLLYLKVPEEVLWRRICARKEAGRDADSAADIDRELLRSYVEGFEVPEGEGELVVETDSVKETMINPM